MKKLLTLAGIFTFLFMDAQITLSSTNAMQAGDQFAQGSGNTVAPPWTIGNSGPSQTWNFTGAMYDAYDTLNVHAISWISPARSAAFPQCQLAVTGPNDTMYYDMVRVDANGLHIDGSSMFDFNYGILNRIWQNPLTFIEWPMTYNSVALDTAFYDFIQPVSWGQNDSMRDVMTYYTTLTCDAWGTITTPLGTFQALRMKRDMAYDGMQYLHDSVLGWQTPTTYSASDRLYEWWVNGIGFPVARMIVDPGNNDTIVYYSVLLSATTDIPVYAQSEFSVYPNPATDLFYLDAAPQSQWEMFDINGNLVKNGIATDNITEIGTAELPGGVYFVRVTDTAGLIRSTRLCVL